MSYKNFFTGCLVGGLLAFLNLVSFPEVIKPYVLYILWQGGILGLLSVVSKD